MKEERTKERNNAKIKPNIHECTGIYIQNVFEQMESFKGHSHKSLFTAVFTLDKEANKHNDDPLRPCVIVVISV